MNLLSVNGPCFTHPQIKMANLKKYEVINPFGPKKLVLTTTVTTDIKLMEKWILKENETKIIGFDIHTKYISKKREEKEAVKKPLEEEAVKKLKHPLFFNTLVLSAPDNVLIFQTLSELHGNNADFKFFSLKLLNFLKRSIIVGNNVNDKKPYIATVFGEEIQEELHIKDLTVDLASYGAQLNLEQNVQNTLGINPIDWDSNEVNFCREEEEEMVRYLTILGAIRFQLGKIYRD